MNQRQITLQTFLQKSYLQIQIEDKKNLNNSLNSSNNSFAISQLWSEKYCQKILRFSNLKKMDDNVQKQKRITIHNKVHKFFEKPKYKKTGEIVQAAELYGLNQIINELDKEKSEIIDLSFRIRSISREDKFVTFKRNRDIKKQQEFKDFLLKRFTSTPQIKPRYKKIIVLESDKIL